MRKEVPEVKDCPLNFNFQQITNSRLGVGLALGLSRLLPPYLGYPLANFLADRISYRKSLRMVQSVQLNQWVVSGGNLSGARLDQVVRTVFRNTARCQYDLYHNLNDKHALQHLVKYSPQALEIIQRTRDSGSEKTGQTGLVITGLHLSNFDLVFHAAGLMGLNAQAISAPQPGGGYRWQNELRRAHGLEITPGSTASLRQAIQRLNSGGSILTGIDWPTPKSRYHPRFFNHPSSLPVHHIHLAMKTGAPVYVLAAMLEADGLYMVKAAGPIHMRKYPDQNTGLTRNAEAVLEVAEDFIRQAPEQWSVFYPVWPGLMKAGQY